MVSEVIYPVKRVSQSIRQAIIGEMRAGATRQTRVLQYRRCSGIPQALHRADSLHRFPGAFHEYLLLVRRRLIRKSVTNARGYTTQTERDGMGLLSKVTYPGGATWITDITTPIILSPAPTNAGM